MCARIHISNFYGTRNKGDELMLRGLIGELNHLNSDIISISTFFEPDKDQKHFTDYQVVPTLGILTKHKFGGVITILAYICFRLKCMRLGKWLLCRKSPIMSKTFCAIETAELVVTTGGPFFQLRKTKSRLSIPPLGYMLSFIELVYAQRKQIPYVVLGQSFSSIDSCLAKSQFKFVANHAKLIMGRESESAQDFKTSLKLKTEIRILPDLGLSSRLYGINLKSKAPENLIGINCRILTHDMLEYLFGSTHGTMDKYISIVSQALIDIYHKENCEFVFITQAINDDQYIAHDIARILEKSNITTSITEDSLCLQNVLNIISGCNFFITTRYHSMIMAVLTQTPFVALSYSQKITSALKDYNMADRAIRVNDFNTDSIVKKYERILKLHDHNQMEEKRYRLGNLLSAGIINAIPHG